MLIVQMLIDIIQSVAIILVAIAVIFNSRTLRRTR